MKEEDRATLGDGALTETRIRWHQRFWVRIAMAAGSGAGISILVGLGISGLLLQHALFAAEQRHVESVGQLFAATVQTGVVFGQDEVVASILEELGPTLTDLELVEVGRGGGGEELIARWVRTETRDSGELLVAKVPLDQDGDVELGWVRVGFSKAGIRGLLWLLWVSLGCTLIVAVGFALGSSLLVGRRLARPLEQIVLATEAVGRGDLTQTIAVESNDEIGLLARHFQHMVDQLRTIALTLKASRDELSKTVEDLTALIKNQTEVIQKQATGITQASATTEEIKQTSTLAASKAQMVLDVAAKADEIGAAGQLAVESSIGGLEAIRSGVDDIVVNIADLSERTMQIGEIVESVKDLADQSNVLALNAAIEAAKAGEVGKGFGVVAREIRSLADQSIQSTNRIREILSEIQTAIRKTVEITTSGRRNMDRGLEDIRNSGENLQEMAAIMQESSQAARQIAASVSQQHVGIEQIAGAITSLNEAMDETQRGILLTENTVSNLNGVTEQVSQILQAFRT